MMATQTNSHAAKGKAKIVQLVILPDTPNTRRLAAVCFQITQRKQQTQKAA